MALESQPAQAFGPYTLLTELGRGGQGTVWLAEDQKLKRKVALKLLQTAGPIDAHRLRRFRREAEAASRLDHPNICGLLDAGEVDGVPYLAFRHVEGETLAARIAHADPDPGSRQGIGRIVALFEKIARALHKAHELGLIHRDIKPGNLMVTPDGEPVVLDFGLARDELADEPSLTHSGDLLGTPAYMSPEQLLAQRVPLDRRTDVYSLGASLYESLTLQRPFAAATRAELYQRILHSDPSTVSSVNRQVPRDLQVVVETAMEKDRDRRYQTALDLAEDLRRVREFEPIRARPIGRLLRLRRWAQRHPALATVLTAVFLLLSGGMALSLYFLDEVDEQRTATEHALHRTRAIALANASAEAAKQDQMLSLLLAREAVRWERTPETVAKLHRAVVDAYEEQSFRAHTVFAKTVEFSPDGTQLLTAGDREARLWDRLGTLVREFPHVRETVAARFSPDGQRVLVAEQRGTARILDLQGRVLETLPNRGLLADALFTPDGKGIVTVIGAPFGSFGPQDPPHGVSVLGADRTLNTWYEHPATLRGAVVSRDGTILVTAAMDGGVRLWDLTAGDAHAKPVANLEHEGVVYAAAISPDSSRILTGCGDNKVRLWSRSGKVLWSATARTAVPAVNISADGLWLWSSTRDGEVRMHDLDGVERLVLRGHHDGVVDLDLAAAGDRLATLSQSGIVRVWNLAPRAPVSTRIPALPVAEHEPLSWIIRVAGLGPRGELLECVPDGRVVLRSLEGRPLTTLEPKDGPWLQRAAISADGGLVATCMGSSSGRPAILRLWTRTGQLLESHPIGHGVSGLEITADRILVIGGGMVELRDRSGALLKTMLSRSEPKAIRSAHLLPGNDRLVVVHWDGRVLVYDVETGGAQRTFRGSRGPVRNADLSPSGDVILLACLDGSARSWDLDGRPRATFVGHRASLQGAVFSPRGDRVLTASEDGTARVWDLEGRTLAILEGHEEPVLHARFLDDGRRAITATGSGNVRSWILEPAELEELARDRSSRTFSPEEWQRYRDLLGDPPPEVLMQERALQRVDELFEEHFTRERVLERLQVDETLCQQERELAVRTASVRRVTGSELNENSWAVVRASGAPRAAYERALREAQAACELEPGDANLRNTLGVALYRVGRHADALAALQQSAASRSVPENAAFLAMAHWQLGQRDEAQNQLQRQRKMIRDTSLEQPIAEIVREAEELIGGEQRR